jgi:hypothetical protein
MKRSWRLSLAATGLVPLAAALHAQAPVPAPTFKPARPVDIQRVKGDLYMISGEGGNVAVYVTADGVILVDNMFYRNNEDIVAKVATITDKPIVYVLNTHQHDDHAGGNAKMLAFAKVIAQQNVRKLSHQAAVLRGHARHSIGLPASFGTEIAVHRQQGCAPNTSAAATRMATPWSRPELRWSHGRSVPRPRRTATAAAAGKPPAGTSTRLRAWGGSASTGPARSTARRARLRP